MKSKRTRRTFTLKQYCPIFTAASLALMFAVVMLSSSGASAQHGFSVKQYKEFHEVLHPLEHEALPAKDFRRIAACSRTNKTVTQLATY